MNSLTEIFTIMDEFSNNIDHINQTRYANYAFNVFEEIRKGTTTFIIDCPVSWML